jgi:hypothetical protein
VVTGPLPLGVHLRGAALWVAWQTARDSLRKRLQDLERDPTLHRDVVGQLRGVLADLELGVAGSLAIWTGLFIYHLLRYRSSGFRDHDWHARHDDFDPCGALFLELIRRSGGMPNPGVDLELWVKSHGNWEVVDYRNVVLMPDKVIRCRFDFNHKVFPGGFCDVLWFRADDRGKLVEIPGERFQLRNHSIGPRRIYIADRSKVGSQSAAQK